MLKYFIIFFFCILNTDAFTQVVIKEEIILNTEEVGDTLYETPSMPFYGRYYIRKECINPWYGIKMEVSALGQTKLMGCWYYNCGGGGWCACQGGFESKYFDGVPMGSGLSLTVSICNSQYGVWQNISVMYVKQTNNRYNYYGLDPTDNTYRIIGFINFTTQTPPGCPGAETCSLSYIPPTLLINEPQGYSNYLNNPPCTDINGNPRLAYSVPPTKKYCYF